MKITSRILIAFVLLVMVLAVVSPTFAEPPVTEQGWSVRVNW